MVFATDNEAGKKIMLHLYDRASLAGPRRRKLLKAHRETTEQMELSLGDAVEERDRAWVDPPWDHQRPGSGYQIFAAQVVVRRG